ncbi:hypothetical protein FHK02_300 [Spirosoma sp. LMG 31448]|uniref:Uncharacterized protein n=1 Tax=Spirosoma utsteinense TaxID=2585773 RepID=A0ABR6WAD4_9BACT|nr:hypothetical protein [Spirosoma utsteinense]MBC3793524.1 hypothetical protein [Spirosoma utsteinense]
MTKDQYNFRARWFLATTIVLTFILALNWKAITVFVAQVAPNVVGYYWISYAILLSLWAVGFYFAIKGLLAKQ